MRYFSFDQTIGQSKIYGFGGSGGGGVDPEVPVDPQPVVIPTDYMVRYDFNGNIVDSSGNMLDGLEYGESSFVEGRKVGTQCISFTSSSVRTPVNLIDNTGVYSISSHVSTTQQAYSMLFELSKYSNDYSTWYFLLNYGAQLLAQGGVVSNLGLTPTDGTWFHLLFEMNNRDGLIKIYVDNILVASGNTTPTGRRFLATPLYIGARHPASSPFVGLMQDVRVYNRVLTAEERTALFNE